MSKDKLTRLHLENFTVFEKLDLMLSPGINVFIGENGTGKTHVLKVLYAAVLGRSTEHFVPELQEIMAANIGMSALISIERPRIGMIVHTYAGKQDTLSCSINLVMKDDHNTVNFSEPLNLDQHAVYIPVKETLGNAPGFRSLYALRHISFERIYLDILDRAFLPPLRKLDGVRQTLADDLTPVIGGEVITIDETFYIKNEHGLIPFSLVAEGIRKIALLSVLIRNGCLEPGSFLFWDEPDANLNPKLIKTVVKTLLALQRTGVQIFLATHSYFILKELDLQAEKDDKIAFHSLYRDLETKLIAVTTSYDFTGIDHDAISDTFSDIYDRNIDKALGRLHGDD